jgi:hypothetical protein
LSPDIDRRRFLALSCAGSVGTVCALRDTPLAARTTSRARAAIVICNVGGPSQLDTWDPKPEAPREIRGPYRAIRTSVPGLYVSELFPLTARLAHLQAFVRACHRTGPATHEAGWRSALTGAEDPAAREAPGLLDVVTHGLGHDSCGSSGLPRIAVLPVGGRNADPPSDTRRDAHAYAATGVTAAAVERRVARESEATHTRYGHTRFGRDCLLARCLVEADTRLVVIRTCHHYRAPHSWDVHGGSAFGNVADLQQHIGPTYDQAYSALLEDLAARGLLASTLVCALAEFGRAPRLNPAGGRDHWPQCWTTTFAGGGVRGGQTVGASDRLGSEPADRPVTPMEILGSICYGLGLALPTVTVRSATEAASPRHINPAMPRIAELF